MFDKPPATPAEWVVRFNSGPLSASDRAAFTEWVSRNPDKVAELEELRALWQSASGLRSSSIARAYLADDIGQTSDRWSWREYFQANPKVRYAVVGAFAAVLATILLPLEISSLPRLNEHDNAQTVVGQISRYQLPDLSEVVIAADTALRVDFALHSRELFLDRGEVFLEVQHDTDRPFVVRAGNSTVTVTGTKFNVNYFSADDTMEVAVAEGSIRVERKTGKGKDQFLRVAAGQVLFLPSNGDAIFRTSTPEEVAA